MADPRACGVPLPDGAPVRPLFDIVSALMTAGIPLAAWRNMESKMEKIIFNNARLGMSKEFAFGAAVWNAMAEATGLPAESLYRVFQYGTRMANDYVNGGVKRYMDESFDKEWAAENPGVAAMGADRLKAAQTEAETLWGEWLDRFESGDWNKTRSRVQRVSEDEKVARAVRATVIVKVTGLGVTKAEALARDHGESVAHIAKAIAKRDERVDLETVKDEVSVKLKVLIAAEIESRKTMTF